MRLLIQAIFFVKCLEAGCGVLSRSNYEDRLLVDRYLNPPGAEGFHYRGGRSRRLVDGGGFFFLKPPAIDGMQSIFAVVAARRLR